VPTSGPGTGDQNPYGVAVVPRSVGALVQGDVLVSNFNAQSNLQGTGTTVMQVDPNSKTASVFAQISAASVPGCTGGVGLTTALAVFSEGWVVVGSLPVGDNGSGSPEAGCLIVLDSHGTPAETITGPSTHGHPLIDGPWDMTAVEDGDHATLYVTNVLNDAGATPTTAVPGGYVVQLRLDLNGPGAPRVMDMRDIADGIDVRPDPAALIVGPTGVGLEGDTLYVADSVDSRILAIDHVNGPMGPGHGPGPRSFRVVGSGGALNDPLGLAIAPNGDIITLNGGDGNGVETTPSGDQVATATLDSNGDGSGDLFGLALTPDNRGIYFVDDFGADNDLFVAR
jgi:hypothetical protein